MSPAFAGRFFIIEPPGKTISKMHFVIFVRQKSGRGVLTCIIKLKEANCVSLSSSAFGSFKSAVVGVFTLRKLVSTTNQHFIPVQ